MNRLKMAAAVAMLAVSFTNAEDETLNIFGSLGAGFGMGGKFYSSSEQSSVTATPKYKDRFFNYGSGFKFDLGCQYFIMDDLALQPSLSYSVAPTFEYHTST